MSEENQALKKIADCLSRRSHSEKELLNKLSKKFPLAVARQALEKAKKNQWLESPLELSERTVAELHNKNKSWAYIRTYLKQKDLPLPSFDHERELLKAQNLLLKKQRSLKAVSSVELRDLPFKEKAKLKQFLSYRGFEKSIADELLN